MPGTQELNKALHIFAGAPTTACATPAQPSPPGSLTQKPPSYPLGWQGRARQTWPEPDTILLLYGSSWRGVMPAGY